MTHEFTDTLAPAEAARRAGVSTRTLRRWEQAGKLQASRTASGQRRYRPADLEAAANRQPLPKRGTPPRQGDGR